MDEDVSREGWEVGTDRPDVKIVKALDVRMCGDRLSDFRDADTFRRCLE